MVQDRAEDAEKRQLHPLWLKVLHFAFPLFLIAFSLTQRILHITYALGPAGSLCLLWDALLLFYLILQNYRIYDPFLAWFNNYFPTKIFFGAMDHTLILISKIVNVRGALGLSCLELRDFILLQLEERQAEMFTRGLKGMDTEVNVFDSV